MVFRITGLLAAIVMLCSGADKGPPEGQVSNESIDITAKLYNGKDEVKQAVGSDLDGYIVVVDVQVTPKTEEPLLVSLDDFLLRSDKDGQKSRPFTPSQIAGRGALVLSESGSGSAIMGDNNGPIWGGYPGPPRRLGGDGGMIGNTSASTMESTVHSGTKDKEDPLLSVLKEKCLPEGKTTKPVSGLLYFLMDGKHKDKQLQMYYQGPAGKLTFRFHN